jgi:NAD-dependent DNA ligase
MAWVRTENGGMSDTSQQMSWQSILDWQVEMFFYSCYLYYVLDNPKLSDYDFDRIIDVMEDHFDELPERITHTVGPGEIKANAHLFAHDLTEKEKEKAIEWKKGKRDL